MKEAIQDLIPVAILIILYKGFIDRKSAGVGFEEITAKINLPIKIIKNYLAKMKDNKLIVETDEHKYIPLTKVENLSIWGICNQVIAEDGIEINKIFLDSEMEEIFTSFKAGLKKNTAQMTIKDLVDEEG